MRLGWAILISPEQTYVQQHIILLLGCIEIMRRSMWAIFRVEWEWIKIQKKNIEELDYSEQHIMDDDNNNNNNSNSNSNSNHNLKKKQSGDEMNTNHYQRYVINI